MSFPGDQVLKTLVVINLKLERDDQEVYRDLHTWPQPYYRATLTNVKRRSGEALQLPPRH